MLIFGSLDHRFQVKCSLRFRSNSRWMEYKSKITNIRGMNLSKMKKPKLIQIDMHEWKVFVYFRHIFLPMRCISCSGFHVWKRIRRNLHNRLKAFSLQFLSLLARCSFAPNHKHKTQIFAVFFSIWFVLCLKLSFSSISLYPWIPVCIGSDTTNWFMWCVKCVCLCVCVYLRDVSIDISTDFFYWSNNNLCYSILV